MKTAVKVIIALIFAAGLFWLGISNANDGYDGDHTHLRISFGEVPEGTEFADILVKENWHRNEDGHIEDGAAYTLKLDSNCEIANYNEDGYASLLLKHMDVAILEEYDLSADSENKHMVLGLNHKDMFDHYRHIKLAYCDKDGNILDITKEIEVKSSSLSKSVYTIKADGSKLTFDAGPELPFRVRTILPVAASVFFFIVAVVIAVKGIIQSVNSKSKTSAQSGEPDNERKE